MMDLIDPLPFNGCHVLIIRNDGALEYKDIRSLTLSFTWVYILELDCCIKRLIQGWGFFEVLPEFFKVILPFYFSLIHYKECHFSVNDGYDVFVILAMFVHVKWCDFDVHLFYTLSILLCAGWSFAYLVWKNTFSDRLPIFIFYCITVR